MRFLSLLIVLALALALAWFSAQNWVPVTLSLWPPYQLVIRLPVLMVVCVLAGWLPSAAVGSLQAWQLRRRLTRTERELQSTRAVAGAPEPAIPAEPFEKPVLRSAPYQPRTMPEIKLPPSDGL
jgi:uncharacterized integral membrane protein